MEFNLTGTNSQNFLNEFLKEYLNHGFQSLSKSDLDLLIFHLINKNGILDFEKSIYDTSKLLKITPTKVKNLILNSSLRWGNIDAKEILEKIFDDILTKEKLELVKEENKKYFEENKLPILLENPVYKMEFENAIKTLSSIPEYTFNKEVLIISISSVIELAKNIYGKEPIFISDLKTDQTKIEDILKKDIKEIEFNDFTNLVKSLRKNITNNTINGIKSFSIFSLLGKLKLS